MRDSLIACDLHDYIEIACVYGYRVRLTLKNNHVIEGQAQTIVTEQKREFILLNNAQTGKIALDDLAKLQVLTPNAQFHEVIF